MSDILKISRGRMYEPRALVEATLSDLIEKAGGVDELRLLLRRCDTMPRQALEIALRRAHAENIMASLGDSLVGISVLMSLLWLLAERRDASVVLVLQLFGPATLALVAHVWLQKYLNAVWYRTKLRPVLERRSKDGIVDVALTFYRVVARRMTIPGTVLYPVTTAITLGVIQETGWDVWLVLLPTAVLAGLIVNRLLYFTRLLHADLCEWAGVFSLELSAGEALAIREARRGSGLYRYVWDQLAARGYSGLSPFEAYIMAQCVFGFVAVLVIAVALVMLDVQWQRVLVVVPLVLGLLAIACSHFMRFAFITRKQTAALADDAEGAAVQAENGGDMEAIERSDIDVKSRILRRAMP